jgi:hypothetical protein
MSRAGYGYSYRPRRALRTSGHPLRVVRYPYSVPFRTSVYIRNHPHSDKSSQSLAAHRVGAQQGSGLASVWNVRGASKSRFGYAITDTDENRILPDAVSHPGTWGNAQATRPEKAAATWALLFSFLRFRLWRRNAWRVCCLALRSC